MSPPEELSEASIRANIQYANAMYKRNLSQAKEALRQANMLRLELWRMNGGK